MVKFEEQEAIKDRPFTKTPVTVFQSTIIKGIVNYKIMSLFKNKENQIYIDRYIIL